MPAWDDDDELTTDPQKEVSLIYYPSRAAWRTASSASRPTLGASHARHPRRPRHQQYRSLEQDDEQVEVRFNWTTHAYRYNIVDVYFGIRSTPSTPAGTKPLIKRKYVVLKNDHIHHWLDIYHI